MEITDTLARLAGTNANDKDIAGEQFELSLVMLQPLTYVGFKLCVTLHVHSQDLFSKNWYTPESLTAAKAPEKKAKGRGSSF